MRVKYYKGDIIEVLNFDEVTNEYFKTLETNIILPAVGLRFIVESVYIGEYTTIYVYSGKDTIFLTLSQIRLYKRPLINWIKYLINGTRIKTFK